MAMPRSPCPISSQALLPIALLSLILVITIIIIIITIFFIFFTIILAEVAKALYCFLVIVLEIRTKILGGDDDDVSFVRTYIFSILTIDYS